MFFFFILVFFVIVVIVDFFVEEEAKKIDNFVFREEDKRLIENYDYDLKKFTLRRKVI